MAQEFLIYIAVHRPYPVHWCCNCQQLVVNLQKELAQNIQVLTKKKGQH